MLVMNEDFVTYELAVKLKEKGFNEGCYKYYENKELKWSNSPWLETQYNNYMPHIVAAPTISQVLKWLREEKGWVIVVRLYITNGWYWFVQDEKGKLKSSHLASCNDCFPTYEHAAIAGVEYCLDNLI